MVVCRLSIIAYALKAGTEEEYRFEIRHRVQAGTGDANSIVDNQKIQAWS